MGIMRDLGRALSGSKPHKRKKHTKKGKKGRRLPPRNADGSFRKKRKAS